jgi:hypothetical protein
VSEYSFGVAEGHDRADERQLTVVVAQSQRHHDVPRPGISTSGTSRREEQPVAFAQRNIEVLTEAQHHVPDREIELADPAEITPLP